jgi:dTDP-4-amino-4,6-dideoxygalactose transaminase
MYGNVTENIIAIQLLCRENDLILIEDCASAMGGQIGDVPVGNFGDYSIFSTGHAKNVDLNNGGILFTDLNIETIENELRDLPAFDDRIAKRQSDFSKQYCIFRRSGDTNAIQRLFNNKNELRDLFLYQIRDPELIRQIDDSFLELASEPNRREEKYDLFANNLPSKIIYGYNEGSFPWRFSILIDDEKTRQTIIRQLLNANLFVSDWYPCIASAFGDVSNYPNAQRMEREILNFSFLESSEDITKTCAIINSVLQGEKML